MHRIRRLGLSLACSACLAAHPSMAQKSPRRTAVAAHTAETGNPVPVAITYTQQKDRGQADFNVGGLPSPELHPVPN
jgi:hypothetical protein